MMRPSRAVEPLGPNLQHFQPNYPSSRRGTTIEIGIARLRGSKLQRALRTESEPLLFLTTEWAVRARSHSLTISPSRRASELAACPQLMAGSKADLLPDSLPAAISGDASHTDSKH